MSNKAIYDFAVSSVKAINQKQADFLAGKIDFEGNTVAPGEGGGNKPPDMTNPLNAMMLQDLKAGSNATTGIASAFIKKDEDGTSAIINKT